MQSSDSLPLSLEEERLAALHSYRILRTQPEENYDDVVYLAAQLCRAPMAFISFVDHDHLWLKSSCGVSAKEAPREASLCHYTIQQSDVLVVPDATLDPRFRDSAAVRSGGLRFYAGAPLVTPDNYRIGSLCVADTVPRTLSNERCAALKRLARVVVQHLETRRLAINYARLAQEQDRVSREAGEAQHNLQRIADNVPVLMARIGRDYRYIFANRTYHDYFGIPLSKVIGHTMREVLGSTVFEKARGFVDRVLGGEPVAFDAEMPFAAIGNRYVSVSYVPDLDAHGEVAGFFVSVQDITSRVQAESALRERTELLDNVLSTVPMEVYWKDKNSSYLGCNAHFARMAGLQSPGDILGKSDADLPWPPEDTERYRAQDKQVLATGEPLLNIEEHYVRNDGSPAVSVTNKLPLHDAEGNIFGVLGVSKDVTERKALEAEREALLARTRTLLSEALENSDLDPLTGLQNHRAFQKTLEEEIERVLRSGATLGVVMLDVDYFRYFNHVYGYQAGDALLQQLAERIRPQCRAYDTLARFGGDEFALLLLDISASQAEDLALRIAAAASADGFMPPDGETRIPLALSSGVAIFPNDADNRADLLTLASERLRLAKSGGDQTMALAQQVRGHMTASREGFPMLEAMVAAVDNKDRYTRSHSEDVLSYSLDIARELGMSERQQSSIGVAALLHDVGKIGVPDHVLRKPGPLTDEEFEAVKQHPMMGAIIVGAVPGFEETLDAVRHHHERWDGEGYPLGLKGEEIPLLARIMAVADAYSAMTTDRPYRKGMSPEQASAILESGAGSQWDPACVDAFLRSRVANQPGYPAQLAA